MDIWQRTQQSNQNVVPTDIKQTKMADKTIVTTNTEIKHIPAKVTEHDESQNVESIKESHEQHTRIQNTQTLLSIETSCQTHHQNQHIVKSDVKLKQAMPSIIKDLEKQQPSRTIQSIGNSRSVSSIQVNRLQRVNNEFSTTQAEQTNKYGNQSYGNSLENSEIGVKFNVNGIKNEGETGEVMHSDRSLINNIKQMLQNISKNNDYILKNKKNNVKICNNDLKINEKDEKIINNEAKKSCLIKKITTI